MRILAPTLALIAVGTATAADNAIRPEFEFGGFLNVLGRVGDMEAQSLGFNSIDDDRWHARFNGFAGVDMDVRFTDAIGARADLWLVHDEASFADPVLRDAYLAWSQGDWQVKGGKMIRPLGWMSPHPERQYRVRASTIGYDGHEPYYFSSRVLGNDPLGGSVTWGRRDAPVRLTAMLNNGFFYDEDAGNYATGTTRENNGLGYGAIATFVPVDVAAIEFQVAYDHGTDNNATYVFGPSGPDVVPNGEDRGNTYRDSFGAQDAGGDALFLDLNATVKPMSPLTIGFEVIRFAIGEGQDDGDTIDGTDYERWQGLLMGNWAFDRAPFPTSVTGMIQHIRAEMGNGPEGTAWEYAVALLTEPLDRVPLRLDGELTWVQAESDETGAAHQWEFAARALLTF
ncbi:MAG TPA: hypothetical protein VEL07_15210 [Planctomycetota bacterium]|nr:hypothetical protein [Planctomycetota bacterium]